MTPLQFPRKGNQETTHVVMIATQTHTQCATEDGGSIPPRTLSYWDHWVKVPQNKESM